MQSNSGAEARDLQKDILLFSSAIEQYAEYCRQDGIPVRLYQDSNLPIFRSLTPKERQSAIQGVRDANEIFASLRAENSTVFDGRKLLWRALAFWGLTPSSDVFEKMREGDFLQIYSNENIALFWSPNLMQLMSLTLEQIFSQPWFKNVERSQEDSLALMNAAAKIFNGEQTELMSPDLPEHYVREIDSEGSHEFMMKIRWACPLRKEGKPIAVLMIHTCRLIGKHTKY